MPNAAAPATEGPDRSIPLHVAIIMDGNGRWAAARGLPRAEGHRRGVEALRRVVRAAHELGVLYLTIFSFSSENWSRPATEIGDLDVLELDSEIFRDAATAGEDRDVLEDGLAAITEARRLDGAHVQRATNLVHHEGREGFAFDVFCDDEEGLAALRNRLEEREEILE